AGIFNNTQDFDPGPGVYNMTSTAHMQSFIVKLSGNGNFIWARQFGNSLVVSSGSKIAELRTDPKGNILMTGSFSGTCDFDPGTGSFMMTNSSGSSSDGYFCKLDRDGNFVWAKSIGQTGGYNHYVLPYGMDIDGSGNMIITGTFIGNYDFDPGPATNFIFANPGDCFILKLDGDGDFVWVKTMGNEEYEMGIDLVIDSEDNIYVAASLGVGVDLDPGPGQYIFDGAESGAVPILKLDPAGNFVYAAPFSGINGGSPSFRRLAIDPERNIYVTGTLYGIVDFDPGPGVYEMDALYDQAPFVLKLAHCKNITRSTLDIIACSNYTLNNTTYDSSGTYTQTLMNTFGCDSIITLNLVLQKKLVDVNHTICTGDTYLVGGSLQTVSGVYYDTLQTSIGCDSIVRTTLLVNALPVPSLGNDRNLCSGTTTTLQPGNFDSYLWNDGSTATTLSVNTPGLYWVTVTNQFNCVASDSLRIMEMIALPADFLQQPDTICAGKQIDIGTSKNFSSYAWSTGSSAQTISAGEPGLITLTVIDQNGCKGTDSVYVYTKQCITGLYFPNAFTPDRNGKNDFFRPVIYGNVTKYKLAIFNRWGGLVFETTDPLKGWDGRVNGIVQSNALLAWTCIYQLEGSEAKTVRGTVLIVK
ncbi:MAG: gliding motility-associated C-terminal domain-containing protein, partial [Flavitalea sp.]